MAMETAGFTGINTEQARQDIINFNDACISALLSYNSCMEFLFRFLSEKWASPKAVEFSNNYIPKIKELAKEYRIAVQRLSLGAIAAATQLAVANGSTFNHGIDYTGEITDGLVELTPCKESLDGQVGMDLEKVDIDLSLFETEVKNASVKMDSLPEGIAFYDPDGNMVGSYNRNIKDFKSKFTELLDAIVNDLNNAIKTESATIFAAKQKATESLNS